MPRFEKEMTCSSGKRVAKHFRWHAQRLCILLNVIEEKRKRIAGRHCARLKRRLVGGLHRIALVVARWQGSSERHCPANYRAIVAA